MTLEVFTYTQYSDKTLSLLHADLLRKDWTHYVDPYTRDQMERCREEMERRGLKLSNYTKGTK